MTPNLSALHLTDQHREVSLWIKATPSGQYAFEIVVRRFESGHFEEHLTDSICQFADSTSAVEAGIRHAVAMYRDGNRS